MKEITVYRLDSGEITGAFILPGIDWADKQLEDGEGWLEGSYQDDLYWIDPEEERAKPKADFALEALPIPCKMFIEGVSYEITEQPAGFEFDAPGDYKITVDAGPRYLRKCFDVSQP